MCGNYTPAKTAHLSRLKDWGFLYNSEKPVLYICIVIGTAVTIIGVPGKFVLPQFTKCVMVTGICNLPPLSIVLEQKMCSLEAHF